MDPPISQKSALFSALKTTAARVKVLEAEVADIHKVLTHDITILDERTQDLNARLKHFEEQEGNGPSQRALAELNQLDARVAQLERPEVEDDAK